MVKEQDHIYDKSSQITGVPSDIMILRKSNNKHPDAGWHETAAVLAALKLGSDDQTVPPALFFSKQLLI